MLTNDQSIKIEQPSHNALTADILIQNNERSVGFAKAFGTLNHKDITKELGVLFQLSFKLLICSRYSLSTRGFPNVIEIDDY